MEEENKQTEINEFVDSVPTDSITNKSEQDDVNKTEQYIGNMLVKSITDNGDTFVVKYFDDSKADEVFHIDYKELIVTDKPISHNELMQRRANVITRPLLDILRKYEFPIVDMKYVVDVLNNIFRENELRAYIKLFGCTPEKVTMNDFDRILK